MKIKLYLLSTLLAAHFSLFAQDETVIGQSRFIQNSNPSYLGLNQQIKVGVVYNSANINESDKQQTNYFFGILSFPDKNFSLGLDIKSVKPQNTGAVYQKVKFSFVYKVQVSQNLFFLPAVSIGYNNNSIAVSNIVFEDQINTVTGFISPETIDPFGTQISPVNYMDLGASFLVHNESFLAGLSFGHINQPNTSYVGELEIKLPILVTLSTAFELDLNRYDQNFFPANSFLFLYQHYRTFGKTTQILFSQEIQLNQFSIGLVENMGKVSKFTLQGIGVTAGLAIENFDFGFQYNFPIQKPDSVFSSSVFELYLVFDFSPFRRNRRGYFKRLQTDNY